MEAPQALTCNTNTGVRIDPQELKSTETRGVKKIIGRVKLPNPLANRTLQAVLCIVHCNKISKPVKGKYLLLCMNSTMYLLLTYFNHVFFKVLSYLILKIKSFMKYFKKGS